MIFISYSRKNQLAPKIRQRIAEEGFSYFFDVDSIEGGSKWQERIDDAVNSCLAMVVVVCNDSLDSHNVTYEWGQAHGKGKRVIPLIFDVPISSNHPLSQFQGKNFQGVDDNAEWDKLFKDLEDIRKKDAIDPHVLQAELSLHSHRSGERQQAQNYLISHQHPSATESLANAINSDSIDVSIEASLAFAKKTKFKDTRAIAGLLKVLRLRNRNEEQYRNAITFLPRYGSDATEGLIELIGRTSSVHDRKGLIECLCKCKDKQALPFLVEQLADQDSEIVKLALQGIEIDQAVRFIPRILEICFQHNKINPQRNLLIRKLGEIGDPSAIDGLVSLANQYNYDNPEVIEIDILGNIIYALRIMKNRSGVPILEELYKKIHNGELREKINYAISHSQ
jgi:hypothetical protein